MTEDPTRRKVMFGLGAALAAPARLVAQPLADVDVVVIGAGAAGLEAARRVKSLGATVVVLEARDRIGGRAFTDRTSLGLPFDLGAHLLHGGPNNPFLAKAAELGRIVTDSNPTHVLLHRSGTPSGNNALRSAQRGLNSLARRIWWHTLLGQDLPVSRLASGGGGLTVAAAVAALDMATDPDRLSAQDLSRLARGDDHVVQGGFGQLVADAGRDVPVHLSHAVSEIDWRASGRVTLRGNWGSLSARRCIVTVPASVLGAGAIRFDPALPVEKTEAIAALPCGQFMRLGLRLDALPGDLPEYAFDEAAALAGTPVLFQFEPPVATMIVAGRHGTDLGRAPEAERVEYAIGELVGLLGSKFRDKVRAHATKNWLDDPWSLGAYSIAAVGQVDARSTYAAPLAETVFFAGEAAGGSAALTVAGAHVSGGAAAEAAIVSL